VGVGRQSGWLRNPCKSIAEASVQEGVASPKACPSLGFGEAGPSAEYPRKQLSYTTYAAYKTISFDLAQDDNRKSAKSNKA